MITTAVRKRILKMKSKKKKRIENLYKVVVPYATETSTLSQVYFRWL